MTRDDLPSPDALRALLSYDPETGRLTWRERSIETLTHHGLPLPADLDRWNARYAATDAAQADDGHGYRLVSIAGRLHKAQRVAWALHYGAWPEGNVRFANSDRADIRLANLRVAPRSAPRRADGKRVDNRSGATGVHWRRSKGCWRARINVDGQRMELGEFRRFIDAVRARRDAEQRHRGA